VLKFREILYTNSKNFANINFTARTVLPVAESALNFYTMLYSRVGDVAAEARRSIVGFCKHVQLNETNSYVKHPQN
jgi:hypothetical protein